MRGPKPHPLALKNQQAAALPGFPYDRDGQAEQVLTVRPGEAPLWVPLCSADNPRGRRAMEYVAARYLSAGIIEAFLIVCQDGTPSTNPFDTRWDREQRVLQASLALAEGRLGVARECMAALAATDRAARKVQEMSRTD